MIDKEIENYIEACIIPLYQSFDKAHATDHVNQVIQNSLSIARGLDVDMDMVFVIAAYHDIGLEKGREMHEKNSKTRLLADEQLRVWFSIGSIEVMADAVEDHRASNDYEPRSIYGKIIAEADRDIDYRRILRRIVQFSVDNFPAYSFDEHFERSYLHMKDKYGKHGYLKLWLDTPPNRANLQEIREKLNEPQKLKYDFKELFDKLS